jgi:hypothetical protein
MNPSDPNQPWARLVAAARHAPDERGTEAPYGFATRVAALAFAPDRELKTLWERLSFRALGVACLLALLSVAANYSSFANALAEEEGATADDPVTEMINLVS